MNQDLYKACENKQKFNNITWDELAKLHDIPSGKILKDRFRRAKDKFKFKADPENYVPEDTNAPEYKESVQIKEDGTQVSDKLIMMDEAESKSPTFVLNAHGYDPDLWVIVNAISNYWNAMRPKDQGLRTLMQSKVTVRPKLDSDLSFDDIDKFFRDFTLPKNLSGFSATRQYKKGGQVLEVVIADTHMGNESLTYEQLKDRVEHLVSEVKRRSIGLALDKILLALLGDIMHFDGYHRQTTNGTQMTTNSDAYTAYDNALNLMIWVIEELSAITNVEVVNVFGNHDKTSSYMLAKAIEAYFKNNENVFVDTSHAHRKFRKIGVSSVALVHGDISKSNIYDVFQKEARQLFGETIYSEIHCGHLHHEISLEKSGVIVRYVPSITLEDQWHQENGYTGSKKGSHCFLWDLENGLTDIWMINCK